MNTHMQVTHQAIHHFKQLSTSDISNILNDYQPYLQAGSFFPDWYPILTRGYACGNGYDEAEDAHWAPFWNQTVIYFNKTYKEPYNDDAKGLIAFLFGVISHGVADTLWHSLNMEYGFIRAMQHLNYKGSYGRAHSDADVGGDLLLSRFAQVENARYWKIPSHDLIQIYKMMDRDVTNSQLTACSIGGFALTHTVDLVGKYFAPAWMQRSNFLVEEFYTYYRGGLASMSLGVAECWVRAVQWLQDGRQSSKCAHMGRNDQGPPRPYKKEPPRPEPCVLSGYYLHGKIDAGNYLSIRSTVASTVAVGSCLVAQQLQINSIFNTGILNSVRTLASQMVSMFTAQSCKKPIHTITSEQDFSRLGHSIVTGDFDNDGKVDMIIGAPGMGFQGNAQAGAVYFINNPIKEQTNSMIQDLGTMLTGPTESGSEFGYAMAVVDLNRDGIPDVAISAPHVGQSTDTQDGEIYVRFGGPNFATRKWDLIIRGNVSRTSVFDDRIGVLGHVLYAADADGDGYLDLIVGSPRSTYVRGAHQRGTVQAFFSSSRHSGSISFYRADWTLTGSQDYELFGSSVLIKNQTMYIGAPGYRIEDVWVNSGKVYQFNLPRGVFTRPNLVNELVGKETDGQFGSFMTEIPINGNDYLAISSKSEHSEKADSIFMNLPGILTPAKRSGYQAGVVQLFKDIDSSASFLVQGTGALGHFGSKIVNLPTKQGVLVSEPIVHGEQGRLYFLPYESIQSQDLVQNCKSCWEGVQHERLGKDFIVADLDNNGKLEIIISSESVSKTNSWSKGFLDGQVHIMWNVI